MDRPSKRKDVYWCQVSFEGFLNLAVGGEIGKFLIYEFRKDIDAAWDKIKKATEQGLLGFGSKVSTRKKKPVEIGGGRNDHVICIYTNTGLEDKERVKCALNKLGFVRNLPYKTDAATSAGVYGNKSEWKPNSGNVIKVSKDPIKKSIIRIQQLYPKKPTIPEICFHKGEISQISNAIYRLANTYVMEEKVVGLDLPDLQIWAELSQHPDFDGRVTIVLENIKSTTSNSKVQFAQDDGMYCYKRLEWYREVVLHERDDFSSDESQDEDFCEEDEDFDMVDFAVKND